MPPPGRLAMGKLKEDGSTASEPFLLVDDIEQRLSGGKTAAVFDQHRLPFVAVGGAVDRNMRGDQHVRHAPQRVMGRQWLGVRDVEAGAGEVAAAESRNEIVGR